MASNYDEAWENLESNLKREQPLQEAWTKILDYHSNLNPNTYWETIRNLDINVYQEGLIQQIEQIIIDNALPKEIVAIWIGIAKFWDGENKKEVYAAYLTGADTYNSDDADWAVEPLYNPEDNI